MKPEYRFSWIPIVAATVVVSGVVLPVFGDDENSKNESSSCSEGKDMTSYGEDVTAHAEPPSGHVGLQRRLIQETFVYGGRIEGVEEMRVEEESKPVSLSCSEYTNEDGSKTDVGNIKVKMHAENVTFTYKWIYRDRDAWGRSYTKRQPLSVDAYIEQRDDKDEAEMNDFVVNDFESTDFEVEFDEGSDRADEEDIRSEVAKASASAFNRDASLMLLYEVGHRINEFTQKNAMNMQKEEEEEGKDEVENTTQQQQENDSDNETDK